VPQIEEGGATAKGGEGKRKIMFLCCKGKEERGLGCCVQSPARCQQVLKGRKKKKRSSMEIYRIWGNRGGRSCGLAQQLSHEKEEEKGKKEPYFLRVQSRRGRGGLRPDPPDEAPKNQGGRGNKLFN